MVRLRGGAVAIRLLVDLRFRRLHDAVRRERVGRDDGRELNRGAGGQGCVSVPRAGQEAKPKNERLEPKLQEHACKWVGKSMEYDDCMHQTSTTEMKQCRNHHKMQTNETQNTHLDPRLRTLRARLKCNRRRPERNVLAPSPAAALPEERAARVERREQRVDVHCSGIVGCWSSVVDHASSVSTRATCDVWRGGVGCGEEWR